MVVNGDNLTLFRLPIDMDMRLHDLLKCVVTLSASSSHGQSVKGIIHLIFDI
jgi:hypothetical protein